MEEGKLLMKDHCSIKFIRASVKTVTKAEYCKIRGWDVPADEDPNEAGVLVEYPDSKKNHPDYDGYISWSPLNVFDAAYRENGRMTFGAAVEALKQGKRVARSGWNGKGMFIFMQVPATIQSDVIPKMQSLPQSVKDEFANRGEGIRYKNQLAMVYPDNTIYGWVASPSDVLEEDWCILD